MEYYFYPSSETAFKKAAINNYVRTVVFNKDSGQIEQSFVRKVSTEWLQTCKNNIATDHRIKALIGQNYEIYSWVTASDNDLQLPFFAKHD